MKSEKIKHHNVVFYHRYPSGKRHGLFNNQNIITGYYYQGKQKINKIL